MNLRFWPQPSVHPRFEQFLRALAKDCGVWIVGGWVRDVLLHLTPHDADFATAASAEHIEKCVSLHGLNIVHDTVARAHGTYRIHLPGSLHVLDVALLRQDVAPTGSRHAHIALTQDIAQDLARRDLTINSMAIAYPWESSPPLLDPFGGQSDLTHKRLRFVGEPAKRLDEDPLRLLRLARFAALGSAWHVDFATTQALEAAAPSLRRVAKERMLQELLRALALPAPQRFFQVLHRASALGLLFGPQFTELEVSAAAAEQWLSHAAEATQDPTARWVAWWLGGLGAVEASSQAAKTREAALSAVLRELRAPRSLQARLAQAVASFPWHPHEFDEAHLARWMLQVGEQGYALVQPALAAARAVDAENQATWQHLENRVARMAKGVPWCTHRPLGIDGESLMRHHQLSAGPHLGAHLQTLRVTALVEGIWGDPEALERAAAQLLRATCESP